MIRFLLSKCAETVSIFDIVGFARIPDVEGILANPATEVISGQFLIPGDAANVKLLVI